MPPPSPACPSTPLGTTWPRVPPPPTIRLYDANTAQCFVSAIPSHQHSGEVTSIKGSYDWKHFCSRSKDGSVKIWDGVSNRCIASPLQAHDGAEVYSVVFSRTKSIYLKGRRQFVNRDSI